MSNYLAIHASAVTQTVLPPVIRQYSMLYARRRKNKNTDDQDDQQAAADL